MTFLPDGLPDGPFDHSASSGDRWSSPTIPCGTARTATVVPGGSVVALRARPAISLGRLTERSVSVGERLVSARDEAGHAWWIAAEAVWSDADGPGHAEHPRPIGLASGSSREGAMVAGLSDRLGWEAVLEFERGRQFPAVPTLTDVVDSPVAILDGRLDHDVPTVVVLGPETVRWGAATTWNGAVRRALYGEAGCIDDGEELVLLSELLARRGLGVAAVDLDTPILRRAGIARCSVQLIEVSATH